MARKPTSRSSSIVDAIRALPRGTTLEQALREPILTPPSNVPERRAVARTAKRTLGERFAQNREDALQRGIAMAAQRAVGGDLAAETERNRREAQDLAAAADPFTRAGSPLEVALAGGATAAGQLVGAMQDPTSYLAPGRTILGRALGAGAVGAGTDVGAQALDIGSDVQDRYSPAQTAVSMVAPMALSLGGDALARGLARPKPPPTLQPVNPMSRPSVFDYTEPPMPERPARPAPQTYDEALTQVRALEAELDDMTRSGMQLGQTRQLRTRGGPGESWRKDAFPARLTAGRGAIEADLAAARADLERLRPAPAERQNPPGTSEAARAYLERLGLGNLYELGSTRGAPETPPRPRAQTGADVETRTFETGDDIYHGSPYAFTSFDLSRGGSQTNVDAAREGVFLVDQPQIATGYAERGLRKRAQNDVMQIVRNINSGRPATDFAGNPIDPRTFDAQALVMQREAQLRVEEGLTDGLVYPVRVQGRFKVIRNADDRLEGEKDFTRAFATLPRDEIARAREEGYDGVRFVNATDGGQQGDYTVVFDPANVRISSEPRPVGRQPMQRGQRPPGDINAQTKRLLAAIEQQAADAGLQQQPGQATFQRGEPATPEQLARARATRGRPQAPPPMEPVGIDAYHGSPHEFPPEPGFPLGRFRDDKINTGEGAQAFGYGHYLAEAERLAQWYRDKLSGPNNVRPDEEAIQKFKNDWDTTVAQVQASRNPNGTPGPDTLALEARLDALHKQMLDNTLARKPHLKTGRMYQVRIKARPEQFMNWFEPLNKQTAYVREALDNLGIDETEIVDAWVNERMKKNDWRGTGFDLIRNSKTGTYTVYDANGELARDWSGNVMRFDSKEEANDWLREMLTEQALRNVELTGEDFHRVLLERGDPQSAANVLQEAGIQGIKYLDNHSRGMGADDATSNYVVFNPALIEILRKYGFLPPVAAGFAAAQGERERVD